MSCVVGYIDNANGKSALDVILRLLKKISSESEQEMTKKYFRKMELFLVL